MMSTFDRSVHFYAPINFNSVLQFKSHIIKGVNMSMLYLSGRGFELVVLWLTEGVSSLSLSLLKRRLLVVKLSDGAIMIKGGEGGSSEHLS